MLVVSSTNAAIPLGHSKWDNSFPSSARTPFDSRPAITITPLFYDYSTLSPFHCCDANIETKNIIHYKDVERMRSTRERLECVESCQVVQLVRPPASKVQKVRTGNYYFIWSGLTNNAVTFEAVCTWQCSDTCLAVYEICTIRRAIYLATSL